MPAFLTGRAGRSIRIRAKTGLARVSSFCCGPRFYSTDGETEKRIIKRDVCIIGGGATGTFAAIRLRDEGKSAAVVERGPRLGGHTITFQDKVTGAKAEAGVVVIRDSPVSRKYFSRFNIPLTRFEPPAPDAEVFVDFSTGKQLNYTSQFPVQTFAAYAAQLAKYPFLDNGFDLPSTLPEDLALPFGEFVKKYDLSPMVLLTSKLCQGFGDLLSQPTLYVMKNFGSTALRGFAEGFLVPNGFDNSELYNRAFTELGNDVLLESTVVSASREAPGRVRVLTRSKSGKETLIKAKKLLITIPPTVSNLADFDLDAKEMELFSQFRHTTWWTAIIRNSGLPDNHSITNLSLARPENLPSLPAIYEITPTGIPNTLNLKYGSPHSLSEDAVKAEILRSLARLRRASPQLFKSPHSNPEFALFVSHDPFGLTVPVSAINDGFYDKLNSLNGHRSTFYTGAAYQAHDASLLFEFTTGLLRKYF